MSSWGRQTSLDTSDSAVRVSRPTSKVIVCRSADWCALPVISVAGDSRHRILPCPLLSLSPADHITPSCFVLPLSGFVFVSPCPTAVLYHFSILCFVSRRTNCLRNEVTCAFLSAVDWIKVVEELKSCNDRGSSQWFCWDIQVILRTIIII